MTADWLLNFYAGVEDGQVPQYYIKELDRWCSGAPSEMAGPNFDTPEGVYRLKPEEGEDDVN